EQGVGDARGEPHEAGRGGALAHGAEAGGGFDEPAAARQLERDLLRLEAVGEAAPLDGRQARAQARAHELGEAATAGGVAVARGTRDTVEEGALEPAQAAAHAPPRHRDAHARSRTRAHDAA